MAASPNENVIPIGTDVAKKAPRRRRNPGGDKPLDIGTLGALEDRYVLLYGTKTAFDLDKRIIITLDAMAAAYPALVKLWKESPRRRMIDARNVQFEPGLELGSEYINLFDRLPLEPKRGVCTNILALLNHLCDGDPDIIMWVQRWIAYPLRNPGAKMRTAIVMHGDEGSGKNLFWEIVLELFGEYGLVINQDALESPFNSWASRKLFIIADEVVSRTELRHSKGRLKGYVTGERIQINDKFLPLRTESNHINFVFLSNETQPLALDESDRRYLVVWTPPKREPAFYGAVRDEMRCGGMEALAWHLLNNVDLAEFDEHTKPIQTEAKARLIELSSNSAQLFLHEWRSGLLPIPLVACCSRELYVAYQRWCSRSGERNAFTLARFSREIERYLQRAVKHFVTKGKTREQATVFLPGPHPRSEGHTEGVWLGTQVQRFRDGLAEMMDSWAELPRRL